MGLSRKVENTKIGMRNHDPEQINIDLNSFNW